MRLPGTRYQEPGWERVRKLLGSASLVVLQVADWHQLRLESEPDWYVDAMAVALQQLATSSRAQAAGNSYGESALELAQALVCELRVLPSFWQAFRQTLPTAPVSAPAGEGTSATSAESATSAASAASLRKKINDLYATLRDRVDADYYQIATGRACSANKIYTWRMLDTAWHEIERLLLDWRNHLPQLSVILGREVLAQPIESRRIRSALDCDPGWIIRWSESREQFGQGPGPLHTRSKRFSSLKNNPATIARMLADIAEYEALSQNGVDEWQSNGDQFGEWLDDYARVMQESIRLEANSGEGDEGGNGNGDANRYERSYGGRTADEADGGEPDAHGRAEAHDAMDDVSQADGRKRDELLALDHALRRGMPLDAPEMDESAQNLFDEQQYDNDVTQNPDNLQFDSLTALEETEFCADTGEVDAGQTQIIKALQAEGLLAAPQEIAALSCAQQPLPEREAQTAVAVAAADELGLPPGYMQMAAAAEDRESLMFRALQHESVAVRLALYSKQLGAWDDSYPDAWLDPVSGELPTMKQLAALDGISLPTLRKRRDLALQRLQAASRQRDRR